MNDRLKRIRKAKPLKKTKDTDAIFANVKAVRAEDPETLEISVDTKAKVKSWGDALKLWWTGVRSPFAHVRKRVLDLDNGPNHSGVRRQFLRRRIDFADWSGREIRLVYYPPYHSKYNPIERCWSSLQKKWNGVLLTCLEVVLSFARRMTWNGKSPSVYALAGSYPAGVTVPNAAMGSLNERLCRSATLPKYDVTIKPPPPIGRSCFIRRSP